MSKSFVTGFPRIGEQRELKFALESFWAGKTSFSEVEKVAAELKKRHWNYQIDAKVDLISVNDFSYYDLMLDNIITFGAIPPRFAGLSGYDLYFSMARGNANSVAMEMTKWFNTNYHYIVPELSRDVKFNLNSSKIIAEYKEAKEAGVKNAKINLIGPITFLALSKTTDGSNALDHLDALSSEYVKLIAELSKLDNEIIIQIDEPIFVTDRAAELASKIVPIYDLLASVADNVKIIFMTYFEHANEAVAQVVKSKIWAIGLDFVHAACQEEALKLLSNSDKVLFAGLIDGRNVWVSNLDAKAEIVNKIKTFIPDERLYIGTSCSLLHVPYTLKYEENLSIKEWLAFGVEKLTELKILKKLVNGGEFCKTGKCLIEANRAAIASRKTSTLVNDVNVQNRVKSLTKFDRDTAYEERIKIQKETFNLPDLPTTTIGSFPQTPELRQVRNAYKKSLITKESYESEIKKYIDDCIKFQEDCGLDVLVHGEPERNDMVEYFGEQLKGYAFSANGWVQSYGSRCVKPPLLFGDVSRPAPMTVDWITYAQSRTSKIMKGMLTGPVTILNWSFVRDDKPRSEIAKELALCIYDEIDDLQKAGIKIIQVDEAAFKEGYPLRKENIPAYEKFAVDCFKLSVCAANASTQIHTHMCYSEFNDIIKTIEAMDADVISIETARSGNELLKIFKSVGYKQEVGPGVYDIHSPRIPTVEEIAAQINALLEVLPKSQLWINPDCGLKTRKWPEVKPSLENMVKAVKIIRMS
ncbi:MULTISPECIES: 5-methyltetrahydropteroyltriglutamate--homocysteine S-methyltransferase [Campylobacter]|uniref:5-methyltetrahydropteroyltriglutamate--homocysteine methyltransferase n=1 Tax=Campylobacter vicugnae TaxID=1660076 RepID=A0ABZ2E9V5_9BACT|nr:MULTISPECIES: 5-methyltetrahydropteroyltriglutamate--homocysteine S-methyltransferase [unclassified Campylobacter]MCR8689904.1 5-methyltetrahydropteroyltriglutamate--homocysteine S-methyltransferase [Campylobacter sp. RM9264]MCR8700498.1 5-methyltetrahydropteroyltriglutamate--homocysteine S-methyltransferase [Campylobacter sp. RM12176]